MSESFLYQAILDYAQTSQDSRPVAKFITITQSSLKAALASWLDLLIEYQLPTTIWLKLPANLRESVNFYIQQEYVQEIYLYGEFAPKFPQKKTMWLNLSNNYALVKEAFFLVKSVRFSGLLFASKRDVNEFHLTYSFEVGLCQEFLSRLQDAIAITDQTSLEIFTKSSFLLQNWSTTDISLITSLLLKQTFALLDYAQTNQEMETHDDLHEIQNSLKVQEDFLRQLAEEMRLPLTNMKTALSLLESPALKVPQRQRYLELLEQQLQRQYALWSALDEWVQIEETFADPHGLLANCDLELVLLNVVSLYQSMAQEKQIILTYNLPTGLPKIQCPEFCLQRILTHLLDNSLKFTPAGGKVSISCSLVSNNLELVIQDTGIGIRNNELSKIFNSFYQGHNAVKNSLSVGLGLTLVKLLLRHCKGSINLKSKPNEGSSFKVILPISTK